MVRGVPRPLAVTTFPGGVVSFEWRASLGTYAQAALGMGSRVWVSTCRSAPAGWAGLSSFTEGSPSRCDLLMTSLTLDKSGVELSLLTKEVLARNPAIFVCDAPVDLELEPFL